MLIEELEKQLGFLKRSCTLYDEGYEDESIRIAVALRTLFRDTNNSTSLMKLLDQRETIQLLSTLSTESVEETLRHMLAKDHIPIMLTSDGQKPFLDNSPIKKLLSVNQWLNEKILILDGETFTREDIIITAANKDGGTHSADKPNKKIKLLKKSFGSFTTTENNRKITQDIKNHHYILLRQFAYEVLNSEDLHVQNNIKFQPFKKSKTYKEYLNDAENFQKDKRHYKAIEAYKYAIKTNPHYADIAYNNMGNSLADLNELEDAKDSYIKAININPKYLDPLFNLSILFAKEKRYDKAIELYEIILNIDPNNSKVKHNFMVIINLLELKDEITYQYENIFIHSNSATYLTHLGNGFFKLKEYDTALIVFKRALELSIENTDILSNIGTIHVKLKNYNEAEKIFNKLSDLHPVTIEVCLNILEYKLITNHSCEGFLLDKYKKHFGNDSNAHMLLTMMSLLIMARDGTNVDHDLKVFEDQYQGTPLEYNFCDIEEWVRLQNLCNNNLERALMYFKNWKNPTVE